MSLEDTLVTSFNDGSDIDHVAIVELDDVLNVGSDGEEKTQFSPSDSIYVRLHLSKNVEVDEVVMTNGSISFVGSQTRTLEEQVFFTSRDVGSLTEHTPSVVPSASNIQYYGRIGTPSKIKDETTGVVTYTGKDTIRVPYLCTMTHSYSVRIYKITPPNVTLVDEDDTYPIGAVFYLKEN